jgi:hypothetical protein
MSTIFKADMEHHTCFKYTLFPEKFGPVNKSILGPSGGSAVLKTSLGSVVWSCEDHPGPPAKYVSFGTYDETVSS